METNKIYHGTCRAFLAYAMQNGNKFGGDEINFTPDLTHAKTFAQGWYTERGKKLLKEFFGTELPKEYSEPVILEFDRLSLGKFQQGIDAGGAIKLVRNGPVELNQVNAREI